MLASLAAAGAAAEVGPAFYAGLGVAGAHLAWQLRSVDLASPADCGAKFRSNVQLGGIVWAATLAGHLTAAST
jgi:4-hydroxybenzoate polyprenyltransferase